MRQYDLVIRSRRAVTPTSVGPAAVAVADGRIAAIADYFDDLPSRKEVDLGETALLPGMVDVDAAVQAPGQLLSQGYARTTRAAAAGGITTLVVAPAPAQPAITSTEALRAHLHASASNSATHVAFLGGITPRSSSAELADLRANGVVGFACSLSDELMGLPALDDIHLSKSMAEVAAMDVPIVVHAEDANELGTVVGPGNSALLAARPPRAERRGLERVLAAARSSGARVHISPFVAAECAAILAAARDIGIPVSAQTCPHYLCLPAEHVPDTDPSYRCRPPLRSDANRQALWNALLHGAESFGDVIVDSVGSGNRPGTGISAIRWTLPALWTAAQKRGCGLAELTQWTAQRPAELMGLATKGRIQVGYDADLVAFEPDTFQRVPASDGGPYRGRRLQGRVTGTWLCGIPVPSDADNDPSPRGGPLLSAYR